MTNRNPKKHTYSIVPIIGGFHRWKQRKIVGNYNKEKSGQGRAFAAASAMLRDRPEVERVHIYHTHPSPGPVDRYVGQVHRGDNDIRSAA